MRSTISPSHSAFQHANVVGVGTNATDTILRLPRFPVPDSKMELHSVEIKAGGQVASAMVACQRWGLHARYVGKVGDDPAGKRQQEEMSREGVEAHWITAAGCASQTAFILVDEQSGERTVLWNRDPKIALRPEDLKRDWIRDSRVLLVDGHDTEAAALAARWAREERIPVVGDFDNRYPGVDVLLESVDFAITSKEFPERMDGEQDLLKSIPNIFNNFMFHLICATLGSLGVLAWDGEQFFLCPGFQVSAVDTTGAGDIFHGAFVFGLAHRWHTKEILEFSCAAAALNCTSVGARGGIASLAEIAHLRSQGRRSALAYSPEALREAAKVARDSGRRGAVKDCRKENPE
jgi:sulfofructose kinase